jgi:hypothetical protein
MGTTAWRKRTHAARRPRSGGAVSRVAIPDAGSGVAPTLAGVLHHMQTAWQLRRDADVVMLHYADLTADLPAEMRRLATALDIPVAEARVSELAREAGLDRMRARARELAPESSRDNWKDASAFFRSGGFGEWRDRMDERLAADYGAGRRSSPRTSPPDPSRPDRIRYRSARLIGATRSATACISPMSPSRR